MFDSGGVPSRLPKWRLRSVVKWQKTFVSNGFSDWTRLAASPVADPVVTPKVVHMGTQHAG